MKKQNQKGITLIALIITIIVMLILVGVTINVALNGGLFEKATEAKTKTQLAADREELQIAVIAALNNNLEISKASAIKIEGWTITGNDGGPYTCTSPKGNIFTVDNKGNITEGETNSGGGNEPILFDWRLNIGSKVDYIFEPAEGMKYVMNFTDDGTIKIKYNEEAEQVVEKKDIIKLENDGDGYKVQFHMNLSSGEESLESDVKLRMDNTNNEDIIAYVVEHNKEYIYEKDGPVDLTKPRVYGSQEGFIIITPDNKYIGSAGVQKDVEGTITKISSIKEISEYSDWEIESNGNEFELYKLQYISFLGQPYQGSALVAAISKDSKLWYGVEYYYGEKKVYIGEKEGNEYIELNKSIDPTPYL